MENITIEPDIVNKPKVSQDQQNVDSCFHNTEQTTDITSGLASDDPFSLIDLSDSAVIKSGWERSSIQPTHVGIESLTPIHQPNTSAHESRKSAHAAHTYLLPSHVKMSKSRRSRHLNYAAQKIGDVPHNRSSTPESIASEIDPYTQWFQMMQQYYAQYYPNCQFNIPGGGRQGGQPKSGQWPRNTVVGAAAPNWPVPQGTQNVRSVSQMSNIPGQQPGQMDYAAYYYEYYFGAAAQAWQQQQLANQGRTTPKLFNEPHIRATLTHPGVLVQILPTRPQDGESGRVELLDMSQLVTDVVAEASSRLAECTIGNRASEEMLAHHSSSSILEAQSSNEHSIRSLNPEDDDNDGQEYATILTGWDRTDHVLYPGPLSRASTLKSDVLAFLRGKVEEIQDRMPVDWDSAGLFIAYLELLIKNNGVVSPGDIVALLLEDESSRRYEYTAPQARTTIYTSSTLPGHRRLQPPRRVSSEAYFRDNLMQSSTHSSGRQSPSPLVLSGAQFFQGSGTRQRQDSSASSNSGAASLNRFLLYKSNTDATPEEHHATLINRFRELLMHGHPLKALEHACQTQLWGHAFALAQRMGQPVLSKVMDKFLSRSIHPTDPLLTFFQLTANEMPRSVDQLAYAAGADNGDWRPHMAMLLSSPESHSELAQTALERMGKSLFARRLLYAAQLCFLLASSPPFALPSAQSLLPPQIWLLGAARPEEGTATVGGDETSQANNEVIQLTEIYEYALGLRSRDDVFLLPQFLPFKHAYCLRLLDAGLIEKTFRYLEVLSKGLVATYLAGVHTQLPTFFIMVSQCLRFADRLQFHPDVGTFESMNSGATAQGQQQGYHWMDQLQEVYWHLCEEVGLPTDQQPFVDPPVPEPVGREEEDPELEAQVPPTPVPVSNPSTVREPTEGSKSMSRRQKPNQIIHEHHTPQQLAQPQRQQLPIIHSQQPPSAAQTHDPRVQTQTTHQPLIHQPAPRRQDTHQQPFENHQPQLQQRQQNPPQRPVNRSQGPGPQASPSYQPQNHIPEPPRQTSQLEANHLPPVSPKQPPSSSFFMPVGEGSVEEAVVAPYDYFASIATQPQPRSRTVSTNSQDDASHKLNSPTPAADPLRPVSRQHSTSGVSRARNRSSTSTLGESRVEFASQPTVSKQPQAQPSHQPVAEEPGSIQNEKPESNSTTIPPRTRNTGWLSGLINRIKPSGKEIILPQDNQPRIIWDDTEKRWLNLDDPQPKETLPPPPLMMAPVGGALSVPMSGVPPIKDGTSPPMTVDHSRSSVGTGRARYVNVLANQTSGSAANKIGASNLVPPLPPSVMSPGSSS